MTFLKKEVVLRFCWGVPYYDGLPHDEIMQLPPCLFLEVIIGIGGAVRCGTFSGECYEKVVQMHPIGIDPDRFSGESCNTICSERRSNPTRSTRLEARL